MKDLNFGDNKIVLTLYEKSTQLNPYYTFQFIKKGTFDEVIFCADNNSPVQYYWDRFTFSLVEQANIGLTAGKIYLNSGEWNYKAYEMPTQFDLNLDNAIGVVEVGLFKVNGTYSQINAYTGAVGLTTSYYKIL